MAVVADKIKVYYKESDGIQWAKYIEKKLSEKQYAIPAELCEISTMDSEILQDEVSVALISPEFLKPKTIRELNQCNGEQSLGVLLGVSEKEFRDMAEKVDAFMVLDWITYELEAKEDAVKVLLMTIIDLYEKVHGAEEGEEEHSDHPIFRLLPGKSRSDSSSDGSLYSKLPPSRQVNAVHKVIPFNDDKEGQTVLILLDRKADDTVTVEFENGTEVSTEFMDKAAYRMTLGENQKYSDYSNFEVCCGSQTFGKSSVTFNTSETNSTKLPPKDISRLDKIRQLLQEETDPICMLCQALRIPLSSRQQLDITLAKRCEEMRSLRKIGNKLMLDFPSVSDRAGDDIWPTLLHFSAEFNLPSFTEELLKMPSISDAFHSENKFGDKPLEIARKKGNMELVCMFEDYAALQRRKGNVPGNKDSGFQQEDDEDEVTSNWNFSTFGQDGSIWSPTTSDPPTPHIFKKSPHLYDECQRESVASSGSNKSEDYEGGDENDNASANTKFTFEPQKERHTKPHKERMQRSLSDKVKNESYSQWYVFEAEAAQTERNRTRRKSESDTQPVGTDPQSRNSKGLKKKLSSYFKIGSSKRKGSLPCDPISEEKLSDSASRSTSEGFPCISVNITHAEATTEEESHEEPVQRKQKKSKFPFNTKAKIRENARANKIVVVTSAFERVGRRYDIKRRKAVFVCKHSQASKANEVAEMFPTPSTDEKENIPNKVDNINTQLPLKSSENILRRKTRWLILKQEEVCQNVPCS